MKLQLVLLTVAACLYSTQAFLFSNDAWNDLKVTWGINPFGSNNYVSMPRMENDAISKGWKKEKGCADGLSGNRYLLNGDRAVMLLYTANGVIAGISAGFPKNCNLSHFLIIF